ncbi:MAG: hypothetical protein ABIG63_11390 [Chloroflexota bacterium]
MCRTRLRKPRRVESALLMPTIGLYFSSAYTKSETNALRARLNLIAASHGYIARRGPTAGQGHLAEMLVALDAGELATLLLPDEQINLALDHLDQLVESDRWTHEWAADIAAALRAALERRAEAGE